MLILCLLMAHGRKPPAPATVDLNAKVTFTCRAEPMSRLAEDLSRVAKFPLYASPATENEVLVVSVEGQPIGQLMQKIAAVTSAEWRSFESGYRLVPDDAARRREKSTELERGADQLRGRIDRRDKAFGDLIQAGQTPTDRKLKVPKSEIRDSQFLNRKVEQLKCALLRRLDLGLIASLSFDERVVYSSRPTHTQRPFPPEVGTTISELIKSHNEYISTGAQDPGIRIYDRDPTTFWNNLIPIPKVGKVLLVGQGQANWATLAVYNPAGKVVWITPSSSTITACCRRLMSIHLSFWEDKRPSPSPPTR